MSKDRSGVFTNPMARANKSPHVGGLSALVVDQTPTGVFTKGLGFIPQPEMLRLKLK